MNPPESSPSREYLARINRVIDFIEQNLDSSLRLETLSRVASFSPFHFHRIFSALVGETLSAFIRRIRLEKAASMLSAHPKETITEIALACGFSSSASFARAFGEHFGMSASEYRQREYARLHRSRPAKASLADSKNGKTKGKNGKTDSKAGEAGGVSSHYIDERTIDSQRRQEMKVEVREMPELQVAYCRHIGTYQGVGKAFETLMRWAGPRGLLQFPKTQMLAVYHDDPEITDSSRLRSSACITVPEGTEVEGEIGSMTVPGGKYAVARFEIGPDQFGEVWDSVMGRWLPESGYQPDDRPCLELYHNDPAQHPEGKFILDICVPVKPL